MLASQLMDLRGMLHSQGIIFAYSGYVTEPVLSGVGEALKQKLTIDDADTKTLRSVFAVFVEQMKNIIRYSAEKAQAPLPPAAEASGSILPPATAADRCALSRIAGMRFSRSSALSVPAGTGSGSPLSSSKINRLSLPPGASGCRSDDGSE